MQATVVVTNGGSWWLHQVCVVAPAPMCMCMPPAIHMSFLGPVLAYLLACHLIPPFVSEKYLFTTTLLPSAMIWAAATEPAYPLSTPD